MIRSEIEKNKPPQFQLRSKSNIYRDQLPNELIIHCRFIGCNCKKLYNWEGPILPGLFLVVMCNPTRTALPLVSQMECSQPG
jgi:hypothetical protein